MSSPTTLNLEWYRGDDYVHELKFVDNSIPPNPLDVSEYEFKAQVRDRPENGTILHAEFDIDMTQASSGIIVLSLPGASTRIPPAFWDLEVDDGEGVTTWLAGSVTPSGDVTR